MQLKFSIFEDSPQPPPPTIDPRIAEKKARARQRAHDWYHANKERAAASRKAYAQANREAVRQICGLAVTPETLSFDHRIPLSKGGSHTEDNLQIAHRSCNYRKGAKLPDS